MKKQIFLFLVAVSPILCCGQSIPNGGCEIWTLNNYMVPQYWSTSSYSNVGKNPKVMAPNNATQTTDFYHGAFAIKLTTVAVGPSAAFAFVANGNPGSNPNGGIPYNQKPTGMRLYYKSNIVSGDTALVLAIFKKSGAVIGNYKFKISTTQGAYTLLSAPFNPVLPSNPDTLIWAAASSNAFAFNGLPGNMLQIDSVSFTGGVTQPVNFNGDFELWQNATNYQLSGWELSNMGALQTTDKYSGAYALELQTFMGQGQPNSGMATTGHQGQSQTVGGYPYTMQNDTLFFYYKYAPANANDSGNFYSQTKKTGITVGGMAMKLPASATYKLVKVPLISSQVPDSLIIQFQSSSGWPVPASYVGSTLKVDNIWLKSQPFGINQAAFDQSVSVLPNPSEGAFSVWISNPDNLQISKITILDISGRIIESRNYTGSSPLFFDYFDISKSEAGMYFIQVTTGSGQFFKKLNKTN